MEQNERTSNGNDRLSFDKDNLVELMQEALWLEGGIYAHIPVGIEIYDVGGVLRAINSYAMRIYGIEDRESVVNVVNLFDNPHVDAKLKARICGGEEFTLDFEYDFERVNKDAYYTSSHHVAKVLEVKFVAIRNKQGELIGHLLLDSEVTSMKEAEFRTEESKKNLEMAMDAAHMSSWVYNVDKQIFTPLYGTPIVKESVAMEDIMQLLHPHDNDNLTRLFAQLVSEEIQYGDATLRFYNKEENRYHFYETRMRLSSEHLGKKLIIGTELDVTERVQMVKKSQDLIAKRELAMKVSGIIHWDYDVRTGRLLSYNDPINDYAPEAVIPIRKFGEVLHPEDYSVFNDVVQSMTSGTDATFNITCRIMTKYDDTWKYCNITGIPFERDEEGNIVRFTGLRQDVSKIHELNDEIRERNYKMELTFKTVGMSYWDFDVKKKQFKAFNDPVNDFNSEQPISPEEYLKCAHPEDCEAISEEIGRMLRGEDKDFSIKARIRTKWDKEWQNYVITGTQSERNKKGEVMRYTGIRFNNTKWEKVTQELKALKEKAELSDRLKSAFLANMSHEIRTPLNAIVGFSDLLITCDDPAGREEYAAIIRSNNELLLRLINDILDLSKIESGILERRREKFNLAVVCRELYMMIQPKITNPNVEFRLGNSGPDCWIFLDRNRLKQVWMNYLTNAVKCTPSGYVKTGYFIENGGIRFYVKDTGVGIPYESQSRVFGRFQKLNDFAQGTGLGLAICKAIIEAAGGEVGFTSTPGVGTTFWAWVPCEVDMEGEAASDGMLQPQVQQKQFANGRTLKILVAEDNDSNYLLVQNILKDYDLTHVENGAEAVNKMREEEFDYILMDMNMPIMNGLEAVRKIREFNKAVVIVALTANAFDSDKVDALEAGCNEFLAKPLNKQQLLAVFRR